VGQGEIGVSSCVHTTAVVSIPGMGDEVQAMKAGLLEIGDVSIVNKADRPGADELVGILESVVRLRSYPADEWRPPVVKTVALKNDGVDALVDLLFQHRRHLEASGRLDERLGRNDLHFFRQLVLEMAAKFLFRDSPELTRLREELVRRTIDPYTAAERLIEIRREKIDGGITKT